MPCQLFYSRHNNHILISIFKVGTFHSVHKKDLKVQRSFPPCTPWRLHCPPNLLLPYFFCFSFSFYNALFLFWCCIQRPNILLCKYSNTQEKEEENKPTISQGLRQNLQATSKSQYTNITRMDYTLLLCALIITDQGKHDVWDWIISLNNGFQLNTSVTTDNNFQWLSSTPRCKYITFHFLYPVISC